MAFCLVITVCGFFYQLKATQIQTNIPSFFSFFFGKLISEVTVQKSGLFLNRQIFKKTEYNC